MVRLRYHERSDHARSSGRSAVCLAVGTLVLSLPGCAATKLYPGPERPEQEISTVYYHSSPPISLSAMRLDDQDQGLFDAGMKVLPGEHRFSVDYSVEEHHIGSSGSCTGELRTEGGKEYEIRVVPVGSSADVSVTTDDGYALIGGGTCD